MVEIKECKSSDFILRSVKTKILEINDKLRLYYKNELSFYTYPVVSETIFVAENIQDNTTIFGKIIHTSIHYRDIFRVRFIDRNLEITIVDPVIYPIVKEEFTKFVEEYKEDIKSVCFIKDF